MKYYSLKKILDKKCQYNMIIGERSNGKTYSAKEKIIKDYCNNGNQGAIIRRYDLDFKSKRGQSMFSDVVNDGLISKYSKGQWSGVYYWCGVWYFCRKDDKGALIKSDDPFCYSFALTNMEHDKSTSYPRITNIVFDEFISRTGYLQDEFVLFMNVLSTIIRHRQNVIIFMLGNTINRDCPYFHEMGLNHVSNMSMGTIDVYQYGDSKLKVAVERCGENKRQSKPSDVYFSFDNPKLKLITSGAWEIGIYPHKPVDYTQNDVVFRYFINYNDNLLQAEIVMKGVYNFTFIHRKTTPLRHPDNDIIFDTTADGRFNYSRKINQGMNKNKLVSKILSYFNNDKVFYADNDTGEVVRNYMLWCKRENLLD